MKPLGLAEIGAGALDLRVVDDQTNAGESEMKVIGPADANLPYLYHMKANGIRQSEVLGPRWAGLHLRKRGDGRRSRAPTKRTTALSKN